MKETDRYRGVWVFAERKDSQVIKGSLELLSLGRGLADELQVVDFSLLGHLPTLVSRFVHWLAYP